MKTVLIISSFVSASCVGATASAFCLRRLGVNVVILPTTLMGRHPGWGEPGGKATAAGDLWAMWDAIKQQDIEFHAVLCGYMGALAHVDLCWDIIQHVKNKNTKAHILIDPVMGDHGKLYISADIAEGIKTKLIPLADTVTPNLWELSFLTQTENATLPEQLKAAQRMAPQALITSVGDFIDIGAALVDSKGASQVSHKRYESVPHGGGDALAATFLAHLLSGLSGVKAMESSVASIFSIMSTANALDAGELPLIREQDALVNAKPLRSRAFEL